MATDSAGSPVGSDIAAALAQREALLERAGKVLAELQERNRDLENVCEAIWPYVRYFGLCGAHPQAIAAVAKMSELLKLSVPAQAAGVVGDLVKQARQDSHEQAVAWLHKNFDARRHGSILARFEEELAPG